MYPFKQLQLIQCCIICSKSKVDIIRVLSVFPLQRIKFIVVWTWMLAVSLFLVSCHAQKVNHHSTVFFPPLHHSKCDQSKPLSSVSPQLHIHWGPQSMMYLKGKRESDSLQPLNAVVACQHLSTPIRHEHHRPRAACARAPASVDEGASVV